MAQLPDGFTTLRPHQETAIEEIVSLFTEDDIDVVFLDAPTGSGKTLIGEMVRRELEAVALYVCSDKSLQDQFARDFPYAKVLKGRANYPTQDNPAVTCADCTANGPEDSCWHCSDGYQGCPYQIARTAALRSELAVTNTAYLLTEANYVGRFSGRELVIADEGDTLEDIMMGFVEYRAPDHLVKEMKMQVPKKGARKTTIRDWLDEFSKELFTFATTLPRSTPDQYKRYRNVCQAAADAERVGRELDRDIRNRAETDSDGVWLRDYDWRRKDTDDPGLILKPVIVQGYGARNLWRHGQKWLIMSATIISADEMADSLGLPLDYATVKVPMTFPVENRQTILAPVADVTYKNMAKATEDLAFAIKVAANKHPGERILVHCVSYKLARELENLLRRGEHQIRGRRIVTYQEGRQRGSALDAYLGSEGAIMLAPSMVRGIDLADDACRVQIIAKCPFPALGDKQVSSRTHLPGGQMWYTVKTIRDIVQMTGRGVRHDDDWCTTYIFDRQFSVNLWSKWKRLFPDWWREGVVTNIDVREFIRR